MILGYIWLKYLFLILKIKKNNKENNNVFLVILFCQTRIQDELVQVQPKFKSNLLESVAVFREDVSNFETSYETVTVILIF